MFPQIITTISLLSGARLYQRGSCRYFYHILIISFQQSSSFNFSVNCFGSLKDILSCFLYCNVCVQSDAGASAREREDMELLEQALKKVLKVRAGSGPSKKDSKAPSSSQKETRDAAVVVCKEGALASAPSKRKQSSRSALKSASSNRKEHANSGTVWSFVGL